MLYPVYDVFEKTMFLHPELPLALLYLLHHFFLTIRVFRHMLNLLPSHSLLSFLSNQLLEERKYPASTYLRCMKSREEGLSMKL